MRSTRGRVFVASAASEQQSLEAVVAAFPEAWRGHVLDVGCRDGGLGNALNGHGADYVGLDLRPPARLLADLSGGLPLKDLSFDTVVALDVLEHVDDIHMALRELFRVARRHVVVALPNIYDLPARLRFVRGRRLSGKYGLPLERPADRHRWLFSYSEARRFCLHWASACGFHEAEYGSLAGPRRGSWAFRGLVRSFPDLFSPRYLALLTRDTPENAGAVVRASVKTLP